MLCFARAARFGARRSVLPAPGMMSARYWSDQSSSRFGRRGAVTRRRSGGGTPAVQSAWRTVPRPPSGKISPRLSSRERATRCSRPPDGRSSRLHGGGREVGRRMQKIQAHLVLESPAARAEDGTLSQQFVLQFQYIYLPRPARTLRRERRRRAGRVARSPAGGGPAERGVGRVVARDAASGHEQVVDL